MTYTQLSQMARKALEKEAYYVHHKQPIPAARYGAIWCRIAQAMVRDIKKTLNGEYENRN